jgi:hypothetical protein
MAQPTIDTCKAMTSTRQSEKVRWICEILLILAMSSLMHGFSIGWGLPNYSSLVPDCVPVRVDSNATQMMRANGYKYPPLQYFFWNLACGPRTLSAEAQPSEKLAGVSRRLMRFRIVNASMATGSALVLYLASRLLLSLGGWSLLPPLLFLLNPMSAFFSHTTNMDQPYLFWFCLSVFILALANPKKQEHRKTFILGNLVFGLLMACAFTTKDHVYGLYPLPLTWFLVSLARKRGLGLAAFTLFLWVGGFGLTTLLVYDLAGGFQVFDSHFRWIVGNGVTPFAETAGGLLGRLGLLPQSLAHFPVALDLPLGLLLVLAFAAVLIGPVSHPQTSADGRPHGFRYLSGCPVSEASRTLLVYGGLALLSYHLLYIQVIRFSYPRFFLPFTPLIALISVQLLHDARRHSPRLGLTVCLAAAAFSAILSSQLIHGLVQNPQRHLKAQIEELDRQVQGKLTVSPDGLAYGAKYEFMQGSIMRRETIRNWTYSSFGDLHPRMRPILVDRFCLALVDPAVVVLQEFSAEKERILKQCGFEFAARVQPVKPLLPALFEPPLANFWIFLRTREAEAFRDRDLPQPYERQLMLLQACYTPENRAQILKAFGRHASRFSPPDIPRYLISFDVVELAAIAYAQQDRIASAENAFRYLLATAPKPEYQQNYRVFQRQKQQRRQSSPSAPTGRP